jgi:hypothetical protein
VKRAAESVVPDEVAAAQEAERKSGRAVAEAGDELAAARDELEAARGALPGAAALGLEAAREARRRVTAAEARLRDATELHEVLKAAHHSNAERRLELWRVRRGLEIGEDLGAKTRALAAVDEELVEALAALAAVAKRREALVTAAAKLREEAARTSLGRFSFTDEGYGSAPIAAAIADLPPNLRRYLYVA